MEILNSWTVIGGTQDSLIQATFIKPLKDVMYVLVLEVNRLRLATLHLYHLQQKYYIYAYHVCRAYLLHSVSQNNTICRDVINVWQ